MRGHLVRESVRSPDARPALRVLLRPETRTHLPDHRRASAARLVAQRSQRAPGPPGRLAAASDRARAAALVRPRRDGALPAHDAARPALATLHGFLGAVRR